MSKAVNPSWSLTEGHVDKWTLRVGSDRNSSGRWRERSTWVFDAKGRRAAEARARKLLAERQMSPITRQSPTVRELLDEFLDFSAARGRAPTTLRNYRRISDNFFLPNLGEIRIDSLTPFDIDCLYTEAIQREHPLAPSTIKKYHALITVALGQAVKWGWIPANPARSVSIPRIIKETKTIPTPDEVSRMIEACNEYDLQLGAFVLLAAITGCRRGELAALRWDDVEDHQIWVRRSVYVLDGGVHVKATKNGRERAVAIGPQLRTLLRQWRSADARHARRSGGLFDPASYLFSNDTLGSAPLNVNALSWSFRRVADALDPPLERVTLHTLRHFAATQLLIAGANIRDVADRLGHADVYFTLNQYVHSPADRQSLAGVMAESVVIGA